MKGGRLTPPRRSVAKLTPLAFTAFAFWVGVGGMGLWRAGDIPIGSYAQVDFAVHLPDLSNSPSDAPTCKGVALSRLRGPPLHVEMSSFHYMVNESIRIKHWVFEHKPAMGEEKEILKKNKKKGKTLMASEFMGCDCVVPFGLRAELANPRSYAYK